MVGQFLRLHHSPTTGGNSLNLQLRTFIQAIAFSLPEEFVKFLAKLSEELCAPFSRQIFQDRPLYANNVVWLFLQVDFAFLRAKGEAAGALCEQAGKVEARFSAAMLNWLAQELGVVKRKKPAKYPSELKVLRFVYSAVLLV
ncbi:MAG: hypothetical protein ACRCT2_14105 [Plesiomonas shigelloides]